MSDFQAVNLVTRALSQVLENDRAASLQNVHPDPARPSVTVENVIVTSGPPDLARTTKVNQVNLFLYQVGPNGSWRNSTLPPGGRAGNLTGGLPLPLNLAYLVSAFGVDDNDLAAQTLLGWAMRDA